MSGQWTWTTSYLAYALGASGIGMILNKQTKMLGLGLVAASSAWMAYHRATLPRAFRTYAEEALEKDLGDICKHYRLTPSEDGKNYVAKHPPCLFVATIDEEIVGMVGFGQSHSNINMIKDAQPYQKAVGDRTHLDENEDYPSSIESDRAGEIRHMSVSHRHRRLGIARKLVDAVLQHAEGHRNALDSIVLNTTEYQPAAIKFYERMGFILDKVAPFGSLQLKVYYFSYSLGARTTLSPIADR